MARVCEGLHTQWGRVVGPSKREFEAGLNDRNNKVLAPPRRRQKS